MDEPADLLTRSKTIQYICLAGETPRAEQYRDEHMENCTHESTESAVDDHYTPGVVRDLQEHEVEVLGGGVRWRC